MKRLNKARLTEIQVAVDACSHEAGKLEKVIADYNTALDLHRGEVTQTLSNYNEKVAELKSLYEGIAEEARDYYEERSEKWQEGEAGQQYSAWVDQLENVDFDEIELDLAEDLDPPETPDFDDPDTFPAESPDDM